MSIPSSPALSSSPSPAWSSLPPDLLARIAALREGAGSKAVLFDLEGGVRAVGADFDKWILELLVEDLEERDLRLGRPDCPVCGKPMRDSDRHRKNFRIREGVLPVRRQYWECRVCKLFHSPLDHELDVSRDGEIGPRFGHDLCLLGVELPWPAAARVLLALTEHELDKGTIRNQILREGGALFELEKQEAEIYGAALGSRERARLLGELPSLHAHPFPTEILMHELDGVMASLGGDAAIREEIRLWQARKKRAEKRGVEFDEPTPATYRETLNARIYSLDDLVRKKTKSGKIRGSLTQSETVSVVYNPALFVKRIYATSQAWEADKYRIRVALGDGGVFDRGLGDVLRAHYEILDFMHAKKHIYDCARALFGEKSPAARGWGKRWSNSLYENGPAPLLAQLRELAKVSRGEDPDRILTNLIKYFTNHRERTRYPLFRKLGLPIGSGAIESANRQVVGDRCKRSGMRWDRETLQCVLSLRAALLSGNWELACTAIRGERSIRKALAREVTCRKKSPALSTNPRPAAVQALPENPPQAPHRSRMQVPERKMGARAATGLLTPSVGHGPANAALP